MNITDELLNEPTRRDRWGRYVVLNPQGKKKGYTRATTVAKALDDGGGLLGWGKRMVALGLAQRPDLVALVASTDSGDKKALDSICERAAEQGGATVRRDLGIALHAALEGSWDDPLQSPEPFRGDVLAVHAALKAAGLRIVPGLAERIVVHDEIEVAGTFDLILTDGHYQYIADIKTGSSLLGALGFSVQLAIYATASNLYTQGPADDGSEDVREPMPELHQDRGIILHVQPNSGACDLHWIDLTVGREALDLALKVRQMRKAKPLSPLTTQVETVESLSKKIDQAMEEIDEAMDSVGALLTLVDDDWRAWATKRLAAIIKAGHKADLLAQWPEGVPTLASGDPITVADGRLLAQLMDRVEGRKQLPFGDAQPAPAQRSWLDDRLEAMQIDEGNRISRERVAQVTAMARSLDPVAAETLATLLTAAHVDGNSLKMTSPDGKPTARRALITEQAIRLAPYDVGYIAAIVDFIRPRRKGESLGASFGSLTIDEALTLGRLLNGIENHTIETTYSDGFLLIEGDLEQLRVA